MKNINGVFKEKAKKQIEKAFFNIGFRDNGSPVISLTNDEGNSIMSLFGINSQSGKLEKIYINPETASNYGIQLDSENRIVIENEEDN